MGHPYTEWDTVYPLKNLGRSALVYKEPQDLSLRLEKKQNKDIELAYLYVFFLKKRMSINNVYAYYFFLMFYKKYDSSYF